MYEKMVKNVDKSLFKGKDLGLVNQVVNYLQQHNLDFEIRGSVAKNALEGNPRHYNDIDLVVTTNDRLHKGRYNAIMGLARGRANLDFPDNPSFSKDIKYFSQEGQMYVGTHVDTRATISREDPKTTIDLCFTSK